MAKRDTPPEGASVQIPGESKPTRKTKKKSPPIALQEFVITVKASLFVDYYLRNGENAVRAYMKAFGCGYNTGSSESSRLLKIPEIVELVESRRQEILESVDYTRDHHMKIITAIANSRASDFEGIDKHDPVAIAKLGYASYAINATEWDRRAARDELKAILGFNKPSDTSSGEDLDSGLAETISKIESGRKAE